MANPTGANQVLVKVYDAILNALRVSVVQISFTSLLGVTPTLANVSAAVVNTEVSYTFPANTKRFSLKSRLSGKLKIAYVSGDSGITYISLPAGGVYEEQGIFFASSIYFQSSKALDTIEIISWA